MTSGLLLTEESRKLLESKGHLVGEVESTPAKAKKKKPKKEVRPTISNVNRRTYAEQIDRLIKENQFVRYGNDIRLRLSVYNDIPLSTEPRINHVIAYHQGTHTADVYVSGSAMV